MAKQSVKQFGQFLKTKYPQYKNVPDEQLGQFGLEKFPQYKSQVSTPNPVGEFVKNIPTTIARTVTQPVEFVGKVANTLGTKASDAYLASQGKKSTLNTDLKVRLPGQSEDLVNTKKFKGVADAAGSAGEAGLNVALAITGLKGLAIAAKATGTVGAKAASKELVKNVSKMSAKQKATIALKDALVGGSFGISIGLQQENPTPASVAGSALVGSVVGVTAPPVLGAGLRVSGKLAGGISKQVTKGLERGAVALEGVAERAQTTKGKFLWEGTTSAPNIFERASTSLAKGIRQTLELPDRLNTLLLNRFHPLAKLNNEILKETGQDLNLPKLFEGADNRALGQAIYRVAKQYGDITKSYGKDWESVKLYSRYLDALNRLSRGDVVPNFNGKAVGVDDVTAAMKEMEARLGPEVMTRVKQGAKDFQSFLDEQLKLAVKSRRISQQDYLNIRAAHPDYLPHDVLKYIDPEAGGTATQPTRPPTGAGKSFSTTKSGIETSKGGSTEDILDPDLAVIRYVFKNSLLDEKSKAMHGLFDKFNSSPELSKKFGLIKLAPQSKIKTVDIPNGYTKVSYFDNGVKNDWLVPQDIGAAIKNLDGESMSAVGQLMENIHIAGAQLSQVLQTPARLTRKLATQINPVFSLFSNPIRDVQTVGITNPISATDLFRGVASSIKGNFKDGDALFWQAMREGAFTGTIYQEGRNPQELLQKYITKGWGRLANPLSLIEELGQTSEMGTRLAVFNKLIREGKSTDDAAFAARNSTVDFSRAGALTQQLNKYIPFLNARIQGFRNLAVVAKNDPNAFVRRAIWTAALPAMAITIHNNRFQSYKNIPDFEKRKYWIFMTGEHEGFDVNGNPLLVPNYIKIPKGEAQQAVSNVVERMISIAKGQKVDTTGKFLGKLIGDTSPVTESSLVPSGLLQVVELTTNKNIFKDKPIVPEYVRFGGKSFKSTEVPPEFRYDSRTTSSIAVEIGKKLKVSPAQVDYLLKTGVLNDVVRLKDFKLDPNKSLFDNLSQYPFIRTVFGSSTAGASQQQKEFILQLQQQFNAKILDALENAGLLNSR